MNDEESKTTQEKLDRLLSMINESQQERKKENFLSRVDGFNNVLLTISVFLFGLLISQYAAIISNPLLSFPIIAVILAMVISFTIGLYGAIKNLDEKRILGWSLVVSCIGLIFMILIVVVTRPLVNSYVLTFIVIPVIALIFNIFLTMKFSEWLEIQFNYKKFDGKEGKKRLFKKFLSISSIPIFVISSSIVISVLMFMIQSHIIQF